MMFTLGNWIAIGLIFVIVLASSIGVGVEEDWKSGLITFVVGMVILVLIAAGIGFYNTHTESGKRALKSWESDKSGGLNRIVHVYDMEGEEIATYQGKFDIEEHAEEGIVKVKFDVDGERHIIYCSTGTVVIDEVPEGEEEEE